MNNSFKQKLVAVLRCICRIIGIKFWSAADVETKYILNAIPYLGKDETRAPSHRLSDWDIMNLMKSYLGKRRNVTIDDFFTLYSLAKHLRQKRASTVMMINKVRRELSLLAKTTQATPYLSVFSKADDIATISTNASQKKCVCPRSLQYVYWCRFVKKTKARDL